MENTAAQSAVAVADEPAHAPVPNPGPPPATPVPDTPKQPLNRIEIEKMREMLREQYKAATRVMNTITELQTKFSLTQAQFEKIGRDYQATSSSVGPILPQFELPVPEPEMTTAPFGNPAKRNLARTVVGVAAIVTALIGWGVVFWLLFITPQAVEAPEAPAFIVAPGPRISDRLPYNNPSAAFRMALAELDSALTDYPGKSPAELLREASQKDGSCLIQWNDGYPSLLFGSGHPHPKALSVMLAQCADAVRRLRENVSLR